MSVADFWRLCGIIARRRWVVLTTVAVTLSLVGLGTLLLPRYYQASALVMPSDMALRRPVIAGNAINTDVRQPVVGMEERAQQLSNLLFLAESQAVLNQVIEELRLPMPAQKLQEQLTVEPLPGTSLLRITVMMKDRDQSIRTANAMAERFVAFYQELSQRETAKNREFLEDELAKAQGELRGAERALADFKRRERAEPLQVAEVSDDPIELERDTTEAQLREMSARAAAVRRQLTRAPTTVVTETGSTDNPVVSDLRKQLVSLESELAAAQAIYQDRHPTVVALKARIGDLKVRLQREMGQVVKHTTVALNPLHIRLQDDLAQYEAQQVALAAKSQALRSVASRRGARQLAQSAGGVKLAALIREYKNAEDTYGRIKASLDQVNIDASVASNTDVIKIVDLASGAKGPVTKGPSPGQLLLFGLLLSLALGLGIALAMDLLDNRVQTSADAQRLMELPVAGVIPEIGGYTPLQLPQVSYLAPVSPYAEAYRFLRTDLLFEDRDKPVRSIMVATARPGQGGTTTVSNLAISLAEAGKRVILVDADLRRPSLHRIFGVDNGTGLTSVLAGQADLVAALRPTKMENLLLLPAGPTTANPSVLINSPQMRELIEKLRGECDFVLFDTPSAIAFSDAAVLAGIMDGVLMVVRAQQAPRGSELQVRQLLNKAGANVIGVVLNDVPQQNVDSFHYHDQYYQARPALAGGGEPRVALPEAAAAEPAQPAESEPVLALEAPVGAPAAPKAGRGWRLWLQVGALVVLAAGGGYLLLGAGQAKPPAGRPGMSAPAPVREAGVVLVGEVLRQTWVRVTCDGTLTYEGALLPGRNEWRAQREITLRVADPGAVELTHNGHKIGALGKLGGEPVVQTFTK